MERIEADFFSFFIKYYTIFMGIVYSFYSFFYFNNNMGQHYCCNIYYNFLDYLVIYVPIYIDDNLFYELLLSSSFVLY